MSKKMDKLYEKYWTEEKTKVAYNFSKYIDN